MAAKTRISNYVRDRELKMNASDQKLARALRRGLAVRKRMARVEGGSISIEQTARLLGLSKPAVVKLYARGRLLGWRADAQHELRFPKWQFCSKRPIRGLHAILPKLDESQVLDDWGSIGFFLQTQGLLGDQRPLDLLRGGRIEQVKKAAEDFV